VTAYLSFIFCAVQYAAGEKEFTNPLDRVIVAQAQRLAKWSLPAFLSGWLFNPSEKWTKALKGTIIAFSDQQVVTGIAILVAGFIQLSSEDALSTYHWENIVNLAWFSNITHLATLTALRKHLQENHPQRFWRLLAMTVTFVMLLCGVATTGYELAGGFVLPYERPAICLFFPKEPFLVYRDGGSSEISYNSLYIAGTVIFLVFSYLTRILLVFEPTSRWMNRKLRTSPLQRLQGWLETQAVSLAAERSVPKSPTWVLKTLRWKLVCSVYVMMVGTIDLYSSMCWEVGTLGS
jgi:hypothetical protein